MPNLRDIRKRIRSVKNTQQITRAMKMVAAAKLRRAQANALDSRPFADGMAEVLGHVAQRTEHTRHGLLQPHDAGFRLAVAVSGDRGLCGGFNTNLNKKVYNWAVEATGQGEDIQLYVIGRKGQDYFRRRQFEVTGGKANLFAKLTYGNAVIIGNELIKYYLEGGAKEVAVIYNRFRSVVAQDITVLKLLPIEPPADAPALPIDYLYEPDADTILDELLPLHVHIQLYHVLLESWAAEQAARMMAMENATKNAGEMIDSLTLTMNKIRQAAITRELIEVVSGASALSEQ